MTNTRNNFENSSTTTTRSSSSSDYYCGHGAGSVLSEIDKIAICSAYRANLGRDLNARVASLIGALVRGGMEPDVIVHAIEQTGMAPRPTPWYLRAILARYEAEGLQTMAQVVQDELEFDASKHDQTNDLPW